ncbi:CMT1A duplicated region transcript 1 protein [Xyrichtys novacula]|uniref:CMT1A duplicated region transcript 1 protein n=1 Tax=Xyrichtys novacula TaxID=13765 RepID=A0AAV1H227_XYRNO|nr:CMT1A duplicated region transcript 1 protein [Xyrichtys novacula]
MKSVAFDGSDSAGEMECKPAGGCAILCGMCPSCVFAVKPPGSVRCPWKVSDKFKRRFIIELLLRCRNTKVLESIQRVLSVTSWTLFTYNRAKSPTSLQRHTCLTTGQDGAPAGVNMKEIWTWFNSSTEWLKLRYLCRLFSFCDLELLLTVANLTNVLLVRQKRGFLQFNGSSHNKMEHHVDSDEDSEDPALMVVPGSFRSVSGVSRYRDFIGCLHVDLSKRILGLLDEQTLKLCQKVCRYWEHLAQETMKEIKFARKFQDKAKAIMQKSESNKIVSSTYAKIVEVPVPAEDNEESGIQPHVQKPFAAAYAKIRTKTVQMEERNVYCGAYYTTTLLSKEDPHRVVDYKGGSLMAMGAKDSAVNLLYVASQTETVSVLKGHVGSIRMVLLCEDRDLLITASCDSSIRCWSLKTDACVMALYGHTRVVNCLDVHADKLVSGAKDCLVKVWSLQTGTHFEDLNFKHQCSVQCVKINKTSVFSSCYQGLIKIWDIESAALIRVIDAHKGSVKCLFLDEWHLLSGDFHGQVMAWSISCDVKESLMTFKHPKEVKSLALTYLRVVTGCADGKIRVFNFLTGDCLREIKAETEKGSILSVHFNENSILVNAASGVKRYQFAKVFWDYTETTERSRDDVVTQDLTEKKVFSPGLKMHDNDDKKPRRSALLRLSSSPATVSSSGKERCKRAESLLLSEKATNERIQKRGPHHPPTRDSTLLRVSAMQRARCKDEVSVNMEHNARLRDSWGPHISDTQINLTVQKPNTDHRRPKTCVPILKRAVSQSVTNTIHGRAKCHSAATHRRGSGFITRAAERPQAPEPALRMRSQPSPEHSVKTRTSLPRISPVGPVTERGGFRLISVSQFEDCVCGKRELVRSRELNRSKTQEIIL